MIEFDHQDFKFKFKFIDGYIIHRWLVTSFKTYGSSIDGNIDNPLLSRVTTDYHVLRICGIYWYPLVI